MSIRGITFNNQLVKSDDDARLHNMLLSGNCGVIKGCETTCDASCIYVATGQFVILGRQIEIQGMEKITPETVTEGSIYRRLVFEIDLTKTNTADVFNQGYFKLLSSHVKYPDIIQEDLTAGGTLYQYLWAEFSQTVNGIEEVDVKTKKLMWVVDEIEENGELPVRSAAIYRALEDKAKAKHSHAVSEIENFPTTMAPSSHKHTTSDITDFPTTMAPSAHEHTKSEITDFPTTMPPSSHKHSKSDISDFPTAMAPTAHNQAASTITDGTFAGKVVGQAAAVATLGDKQFRNIYAGTVELVSGTSALPAGDIYVQYE